MKIIKIIKKSKELEMVGRVALTYAGIILTAGILKGDFDLQGMYIGALILSNLFNLATAEEVLK